MKKIPIFLILIVVTSLTFAFTPLAFGVTWSNEFRLTTWPSFEGLPSMVQMADGRIWIAMETTILGNAAIVYRAYNWVQWTETYMLTDDPNNNISPALVQTENGIIWLFFASDRNGNYDIFCKTSNDNGNTWSSDVQLTSDWRDENAPSAVATQDNKIWLVYQRGYPNQIPTYDVFYMIYDGNSWLAETPLVTDPSYDQVPSITQTRDGRIWVAWASYRTGDYEIYYKIFNGASWSTEYRLTDDTNVDVDPTVAQARDGAIWIVWTSTKPTPSATDDLYYVASTDNGTNWSSIVQLTSDTSDDMWSSVAQMSDKRIWVAWASNRLENYDIYYKFTDPILIHDVAITNITPSANIVNKGDIVNINVMAENQGDFSETFTVNAYANSYLIGSSTITLTPSDPTTVLVFPWSTVTYPLGTYVISATASVVLGENEINRDDNSFIDGIVWVVIHDLAVTSVSTSKSTAAQNFGVKIYVTVQNEGNIGENFNLVTFYDSTPIETKQLSLGAYTTQTFIFNWNTVEVTLGTYTVSATVEPVPGEVDTLDNTSTDGTVTVVLTGDVDMNGNVDIVDVALIARALGTNPSWPAGTDWNQWNPNADIDNNNVVNAIDLSIVGRYYGTQAPP